MAGTVAWSDSLCIAAMEGQIYCQSARTPWAIGPTSTEWVLSPCEPCQGGLAIEADLGYNCHDILFALIEEKS
jgi:hypothetical protein